MQEYKGKNGPRRVKQGWGSGGMVQEVDEEEINKTKELWKESEKLPHAVL